MKVYFGTDHAGFQLKEELKRFVADLGHDVEDLGNAVLDESDDYPDFIYPVAQKVGHEPDARGIVLGGSGQGEAMVANKVRGIRCAIGFSVEAARLSREHNDANMLSLGARLISSQDAKKIVKVWLETPFTEEERHIRRIKKIRELESKSSQANEAK